LDNFTIDYGIPYVSANRNTFQAFIDDLKDEGIITEWAKEFSLYDGTELLDANPNSTSKPRYIGVDGNSTILKGLSRWLDFIPDVKAGGLTHIGPDRSKKRSWMINLSDFSVFECDAVIIAEPAPEAYGIIQTAQDETPARRIIRYIDEIRYNGCFSLAVTFDKDVPSWKGIECNHQNINWIGNESSKREGADKTVLVIQSTPEFFRKYYKADNKTVKELLLEEAAQLIGPWLIQPQSSYLHRWKHYKAQNPIDEYFMELEMEEAPLALIGDYLGGNTIESSYISGYNLAVYWINKYSEVTTTI
jgi:predicted NAD/FAD-dependent oxidoreductase